MGWFINEIATHNNLVRRWQAAKAAKKRDRYGKAHVAMPWWTEPTYWTAQLQIHKALVLVQISWPESWTKRYRASVLSYNRLLQPEDSSTGRALTWRRPSPSWLDYASCSPSPAANKGTR
eukprot:1142675-Pelagomonas_calceolata.AAC.8